MINVRDKDNHYYNGGTIRTYKMKRITTTLALIVATGLGYYEYKFHQQVNNIESIVTSNLVTTKKVYQVTTDTLTLLRGHNLTDEYHCLASNIYWESRNQSILGQMAVGQVAMNRVDSEKYPNTICGVITQTKYYPSGGINLHDCQFSWFCDGKSDIPFEREMKVYGDAYDLAIRMIDDRPFDVTQGSTHYHNTKVNPYWIYAYEKVTQIEDHIFYRSN